PCLSRGRPRAAPAPSSYLLRRRGPGPRRPASAPEALGDPAGAFLLPGPADPRRGEEVTMRYEFSREGEFVGAAQWEGPAQVEFDLSDEQARDEFKRFFAREEVYLGSGHDGEEFQVRRRDWTPW